MLALAGLRRPKSLLWQGQPWPSFTVRIHRSHTPPWCDPVGGLKVHLMPLAKRNSWILSWFHSRTALRSSFSPFTKFPSLSDLTSSGWPLLAMDKHVKRTPKLLPGALPRRTLKGPKQSTPIWLNGGAMGLILSWEKLAIFCWPTGAFLFLQSKQELRIRRRETRALIGEIVNKCNLSIYV